jgi:O-acetylhomoserine/O-acetylserine sulfhydrylase-like pyridoxal-dependent enzyme
MVTLAGDVRGSLRQVAEEQSGIRGQLQEQSKQAAQLGVDVTRMRIGMESMEQRIAKLEKTAAGTMWLLWVAVGLMAVVVAILVVRKH